MSCFNWSKKRECPECGEMAILHYDYLSSAFRGYKVYRCELCKKAHEIEMEVIGKKLNKEKRAKQLRNRKERDNILKRYKK